MTTDTVYVRATDYSRNIYHTDPECHAITNGHVAKPRDVLPNHTECSVCAGEVERRGKGETTCPYCGEVLYRLREHLPCEGVEDGE